MVHGILAALLTPTSEDGSAVNYETLRRLVDFHIQSGVHGCFVCGGSGEGLLLTPQERQAVLETVVEAGRRIHFISPSSTRPTALCIAPGARPFVRLMAHFNRWAD